MVCCLHTLITLELHSWYVDMKSTTEHPEHTHILDSVSPTPEASKGPVVDEFYVYCSNTTFPVKDSIEDLYLVMQ